MFFILLLLLQIEHVGNGLRDFSITLYMCKIEFCKVIEIVGERKHLRRCTTAHSKANVTLMFVKILFLRSELRNLRNYAIFLPLLSVNTWTSVLSR
jgi:hypothetical protein